MISALNSLNVNENRYRWPTFRPLFPYDAANIDGASERQQFWYVTLPGLRNEIAIFLFAVALRKFTG